MSLRVVFDTSTLVGAALRSGSVPDQALQRALDSCEVCICAQSAAELQEAFAKPRLARLISAAAGRAFLDLLSLNARGYLVYESEIARTDPPCRDPRDNFILALALAAQADVIVSSDHDLLVLHPWRGIPILAPADFVAQFAA